MLEFALVLPLLMLLVVGLMDLGRFFAIRTLLYTGAARGLNEAQKVSNFDIDIRAFSPESVEYRRFVIARNMAMKAAEALPLSTLLTDQDTASDSQLSTVTTTDNGLALGPGGSPPSVVSGAAVLRPGDCADIEDFGRTCNRDSLHIGDTDPLPDVPPSTLMETHPLKVVLRAKLRPFLPFLGTIQIEGSAMGFREQVPQGTFAAGVDPDTSYTGEPVSPASTAIPVSEFPAPTPTQPFPCIVDWAKCIQKSARPPYLASQPGIVAGSNGECLCVPMNGGGSL